MASLPKRSWGTVSMPNERLFADGALKCATFKQKGLFFDLEILGGPAYAHLLLEAKTDESSAYEALRQQSESAGISWTAGARIGVSGASGVGMKTGLFYTQINDKFTYRVGSRMDVSVIFGPNGEIVGRDTVFVAAYDETRSNHLRFVEIPVLVGYEWKWNRLRAGVQVGAHLNLLFDARGAIYSPATMEPIAFGQEGDRDVLPIFKSQASTSLWQCIAGLQLAKPLQPASRAVV
ncbi:MAG: hypothetical protein R2795_07960 [Saprospiraceae bacterium]